MNFALPFIRMFFLVISTLFFTLHINHLKIFPANLSIIAGAAGGLFFSLFLFGFEKLFKKSNLRAFNITILGLFLGYLMGQTLTLIFGAIAEIIPQFNTAYPVTVVFIKIPVFLFGIYLGTMFTLRASDELHISIPFVKFSPSAQKKKDLLLDISALNDSRIIDLASSGLIDNHLTIPRFLIKDLFSQIESPDEAVKIRAKKCIENAKKLEEVILLGLKYNESDFPEIKDYNTKLIHMARLMDAHILASELTPGDSIIPDGVRIITLHGLANALKPLMQAGSFLKIKVQRYGKEPRQGVGYLDDGTMVVINGGGDFIGENIETRVLSVKHTSSGRMIFCNAIDAEEYQMPQDKEDNEY